MPRHLRSLFDLTADEMTRLVLLAKSVKAEPRKYGQALAGKSVALIFAKQSTRTRVSFEVGTQQLGGQPLVLSTSGGTGMQMGRGETVHDTAKVLSRFVDMIGIRTFAQGDVEELARHASVPVINMLTDRYHPCQGLADALTLSEHVGPLRGKTLVYAGAGNNVAHSTMILGPRIGMNIVLACPDTLPPDPELVLQVQAEAKVAGTTVRVESDLMKAAEGAHALYTDTWVSMGEEEESERLLKQLEGFTITKDVMDNAADGAKFLHCLPAHRGEEVSEEVMDGEWSVVFDQAENRMHAQKALMLLLAGAEPWS